MNLKTALLSLMCLFLIVSNAVAADFLKDNIFYDTGYADLDNNTQCIFPNRCAFPDFTAEGQYLDGEYVYQMDIFNGVPSYLNSNNDGLECGSYYQCTEYVEIMSSLFCKFSSGLYSQRFS